ncbi:MAG: alanine--tRNA ligase-related protein [Faecalicatena sp.]|uniref:alanyl-tRNA editing protein n=1 Tax=Faecalicatena sp. TaxID=2005360 RepID=UPI00258CB75E|nr:alanine--tRNA ligase-related protein [Faecalicatena sp.]MCI6465050.1 alanine--tRNA ligase-related protein [Faecalicatena sp.]MDY5617119.1 alanine--tRNA ligase-related protein [Lachnospiraceae bacterium]
MTEKLFYQDSHQKEFTANVQMCQPKGEAYEVVLDRTAFFPEGGGQYADTGLLGDVRVLDVHERDGLIYHLTEAPIEPGTEVTGKIDWELRFMKMQQHTGEHIVSGLVHERFGYHNVGFHLGSEDCTMDFNGEITKEELKEIEWAANEAVYKNLKVQVSYPSKEELETLEYRSKIEIEGQVRIVTIPGYDVCACCAPHVEYTGEIGMVKLTNVQRYKGGVRVTMLCGFRALRDYREKERHVKNISALLCAKENEVSKAVEHLKEEQARWKAKLSESQRKLLEYRAREIPQEEAFTCLFENELEGDGPRILMNLVLAEGKKGCAVFLETGREEYRYVIGSKSMDVRPIAKGLNEMFSGRGGGKPEMVQGSLKGNKYDVREWIQKKVRETTNE